MSDVTGDPTSVMEYNANGLTARWKDHFAEKVLTNLKGQQTNEKVTQGGEYFMPFRCWSSGYIFSCPLLQLLGHVPWELPIERLLFAKMQGRCCSTIRVSVHAFANQEIE